MRHVRFTNVMGAIGLFRLRFSSGHRRVLFGGLGAMLSVERGGGKLAHGGSHPLCVSLSNFRGFCATILGAQFLVAVGVSR